MDEQQNGQAPVGDDAPAPAPQDEGGVAGGDGGADAPAEEGAPEAPAEGGEKPAGW